MLGLVACRFAFTAQRKHLFCYAHIPSKSLKYSPVAKVKTFHLSIDHGAATVNWTVWFYWRYCFCIHTNDIFFRYLKICWYLCPGVRSRCAFMKNDITALSKGCQFWKVRSGTDWYLRRFWLDTERMCLRYVPSQKPFWNSCPTHGKYPLFVFRPMHVIKWKYWPPQNCSRDKIKTTCTIFVGLRQCNNHLSLYYLVSTILYWA
jgi:hypothetical protein